MSAFYNFGPNGGQLQLGLRESMYTDYLGRFEFGYKSVNASSEFFFVSFKVSPKNYKIMVWIRQIIIVTAVLLLMLDMTGACAQNQSKQELPATYWAEAIERFGVVKADNGKEYLKANAWGDDKRATIIDTCNRLQGVAYLTGKILVEPLWDRVFGTDADDRHLVFIGREGRRPLHLYHYAEGRFGVVDTLGNIIAPLIYTSLGPIFDSVGIYTKSQFRPEKERKPNYKKPPYSGKWGLFHVCKGELTGEIYDWISLPYGAGHGPGYKGPFVYAVKVGNKYGAIDKTGKIVVPLIYNSHKKLYDEGVKPLLTE